MGLVRNSEIRAGLLSDFAVCAERSSLIRWIKVFEVVYSVRGGISCKSCIQGWRGVVYDDLLGENFAVA